MEICPLPPALGSPSLRHPVPSLWQPSPPCIGCLYAWSLTHNRPFPPILPPHSILLVTHDATLRDLMATRTHAAYVLASYSHTLLVSYLLDITHMPSRPWYSSHLLVTASYVIGHLDLPFAVDSNPTPTPSCMPSSRYVLFLSPSYLLSPSRNIPAHNTPLTASAIPPPLPSVEAAVRPRTIDSV